MTDTATPGALDLVKLREAVLLALRVTAYRGGYLGPEQRDGSHAFVEIPWRVEDAERLLDALAAKGVRAALATPTAEPAVPVETEGRE